MTTRAVASELLALMCFVAGVYGPLLALLPHLAHPEAVTLPAGRQMLLLGRSLLLALSVALLTMPIGLGAALVMWQWRRGLLAYLRWLPLAVALIPPYVHALVWLQVGAGLNRYLDALGAPPLPEHGWVASWLALALAHLPLSTGLALVGLGMVGAPLVEVARTLRPDAEVLRAIVLPLAAPALAAGAGLIFVLSLMDYSVPSLLSVNVYALDIFAEYSASGDPAGPLLMALPLLVVAALVLVGSQSVLRHVATTPAPLQSPGGGGMRYPLWLSAARALALALLIAELLVLLGTLTLTSGGATELVAVAADARREIAYTAASSLAAALACLPLAVLAAHGMAQSDARGWLWRLLVTAPLIVPGPLVGIGLASLNLRFGGGLWLPALAALARFTPFAAFVVLAQARRIDPLLLDAARVHHTCAARTWLQVRLPLLAPGLLAAAAVVFALAAGELGATLIVAPPGWATLTMRIYNYLHYGASAEVAGLCLLMAAVAVVAGSGAAFVLARWSGLLRSDAAGSGHD